ncbi:type II toxin-antitoxin system VapC family toxin [Azospirillum brasilense]|uniref:type II toxin-antitoxin system VapC family toxin n=1 Tax=Azospirillum brasilense TaxID=192 RepID=UPI000E69E813|nr:type II toxin-antitoxin system VapC family toxin [Azospirillum brasilense]NUB26150.1 PIN domain-containing protein [Azospirillum brasilense]NUB33343.1 PIN domain-containing protein [Azospirillum brasilense]RIW02394.1 type II toxin-antitoxin system VapC family toxin [Azospirillum brasilense]
MVIDSSVVIAILLGEPERETFLDAIAAAPNRFMSALSVIEIGIVAHTRLGARGFEQALAILDAFAVDIVPVTRRHAEIALEAHQRFGKGRHPARLNMGDCCSYALAQDLSQPLLFKGDDFTRTDVALALPL